MINVKNQKAADQARELSYNLMENALNAFAGLPAGVDVSQLLEAVHIRVIPRRDGLHTGTFRRAGHPHETVTFIADRADMAGLDHEQAVQQLTTFKTSQFGVGHTAKDVALRRRDVLARLNAERSRLSRPLGVLSLLPGVKDRRHAQWNSLWEEALNTLEGVPLSPVLFDQVASSVFTAAGIDSESEPKLDSIRAQAVTLHDNFRAHWKDILMLAWEAIATDDDDGFGQQARFDRFGKAKSRARRDEEKKEKEGRQRAEKLNQEAERRKRAQVRAEIEARREARQRQLDQLPSRLEEASKDDRQSDGLG